MQRISGGESLRDIARAWQIPYRRLVEWVAGNADLTEQCKRAMELAGIELRLEGLEIIDDATPETVAVAKEQAQYRERLSRDFNRRLFGKFQQHKHEHSFDLGEQLRRARERVIEVEPSVLGSKPESVPSAPSVAVASEPAVEHELI